MSEDREPFFTADERIALARFDPRGWVQWWSTQSFIAKALLSILAVILAYGLWQLLLADAELGLMVLASVALPIVGLALLYVLGNVFVATMRRTFRNLGILGFWLQIRESVFAFVKFAFWSGFAGGLLVAYWPYLSFDIVKSWYAIRHDVPVDRIAIQKKPHDCEFATAPLGSKHCHYDAKVLVLNSAHSSDGKRALRITYERVDD